MIFYIAIYRLSIFLYTLTTRFAVLFNNKAKLFVSGRRNLIHKIQTSLANESRRRIWVHCASLGEFEQGRPVIEKLRDIYPDFAIIITFFSPSGYEIRKDYNGADYVFYLPMDTPRHAARFLDAVQPQLCVFVKYEFWYYYLSAIKKRNIPVLLVSAIFRPEQIFFKWYGGLQRYILGCFTYLFVQNDESLQLLNKIHITNVSVSGDTRFDRVIEIARQKQSLPIAETFCSGKKVIIAGSTWPEDEGFLKKAFAMLHEPYRLIIVPHEVYDAHIRQIEQLFEGSAVTWSNYKSDTEEKVLIVDKIGLLSSLYQYAHVAWIGGGFGKAGIHNAPEAAVYGVPCMYGPVYYQFAEAIDLIEAAGAVSVEQPGDFVRQINQWQDMDSYTNAAVSARKFIYSRQGATQVILDYINKENILVS